MAFFTPPQSPAVSAHEIAAKFKVLAGDCAGLTATATSAVTAVRPHVSVDDGAAIAEEGRTRFRGTMALLSGLVRNRRPLTPRDTARIEARSVNAVCNGNDEKQRDAAELIERLEALRVEFAAVPEVPGRDDDEIREDLLNDAKSATVRMRGPVQAGAIEYVSGRMARVDLEALVFAKTQAVMGQAPAPAIGGRRR